MRVEPIPSEYVKAFWDRVWELVAKPVADLGGLGCFIVALSIVTILVLVYRVPCLRRAVYAALVAMWIAVAISVILIILGGG